MNGAIEKLADERLIALSAEIEVQLDKNAKMRPIIWLLAEARKRASAAMTSLVLTDASKVEDVRAFQNEVRLYDDLVTSCRALIERGREADKRIDEQDRSALADIILQPEDRDVARLLGAEPEGQD